MASRDDIQRAIDDVSRTTGLGSMSDAYTNMLRGINHRGLGNPINANHDNSGIVFFTRPDLNLSYDNLATHRTLTPLATSNAPLSIQRYIRAVLDPKGARNRGVTTPLFDHRNPFIPLLTNNILSLSGWPDIAPETYTSKEGIRKETWSKIDGVYYIYNQFDLTANFRNIAGDPITTMFNVWLQYAVSVTLGEMVPYPENIVESRLDYNTRIYSFVLDPGRRFIQKAAITGASFPTTSPMGAAFNFVGDKTFVQSTEQINVQFNCTGAQYNDPIIFEEFNRLVANFNPQLTIEEYDDTRVRIRGQGKYFQLTRNSQGIDILKKGNYRGTPLIHPLTHELLWFVDTEEFNALHTGI